MSLLRYAVGLSLVLCLPVIGLSEQVRGRITRIDLKKKEIVLEGRGPARGEIVRLRLGPDTQIFLGGEAVKVEDLEIGKRVRVVFERQGGQAVAQTIHMLDLRRVVGALAGGAPGAGPFFPPRNPPAEPAPAPSPPAADGSTITGTLQRVALTDREIVVVGPGSKGQHTETTIAVPEKVTIRRGEGATRFDALQEGETVTIQTEKQKGRLTAVAIQVGSSAAATRPNEPAPAAPEPADPQPSAPPPPERPRPIPRLRQALHMLDQVLEQIEQGKREQARDERP